MPGWLIGPMATLGWAIIIAGRLCREILVGQIAQPADHHRFQLSRRMPQSSRSRLATE
jgi:hypothetical protein